MGQHSAVVQLGGHLVMLGGCEGVGGGRALNSLHFHLAFGGGHKQVGNLVLALDVLSILQNVDIDATSRTHYYNYR